ncbi:uncharacterized protein LOC111639709 [Centruroides sculpturatus]|uniref:uncharacterized protein LOC111639709 n=1 Tax=Centruroides sculpturatus TaxID=218467 RepID=UPI000C6DFC35|nr:uncharacterized protein LOC111639709 [Centruroides sculpturatus]
MQISCQACGLLVEDEKMLGLVVFVSEVVYFACCKLGICACSDEKTGVSSKLLTEKNREESAELSSDQARPCSVWEVTRFGKKRKTSINENDSLLERAGQEIIAMKRCLRDISKQHEEMENILKEGDSKLVTMRQQLVVLHRRNALADTASKS